MHPVALAILKADLSFDFQGYEGTAGLLAYIEAIGRAKRRARKQVSAAPPPPPPAPPKQIDLFERRL